MVCGAGSSWLWLQTDGEQGEDNAALRKHRELGISECDCECERDGELWSQVESGVRPAAGQ